MSTNQYDFLNSTIERLGKSGEKEFNSIEALHSTPHFEKFVHYMCSHYKWVEIEHMADLLALGASMFQAGLNVGVQYERDRQKAQP